MTTDHTPLLQPPIDRPPPPYQPPEPQKMDTKVHAKVEEYIRQGEYLIYAHGIESAKKEVICCCGSRLIVKYIDPEKDVQQFDFRGGSDAVAALDKIERLLKMQAIFNRGK